MEKDDIIIFLGIILIASILVIGVPLLVSQAVGFEAFGMAIMIIFGIIALLAVLTLAGRVFINTGVECKEEALGLPSGSIRALIALGLIIIFAMMAVYMFNQYTPEGMLLQIDGNKTLILPNGTSLTDPNGFYVLNEPSQAQRDLTTQILTTISTLVVAIAGFYFGTKSVAQAQKSNEPPEVRLSIDPESPTTLQLKGKPEDDKLLIKVKTTPEFEALDFEVKDEKEKGVITRSLKQNEFVFTPPANVKSETTATLKFWMTRYPSDSKEIEIKIIPVPKPQPSVDEKIKTINEELLNLTQRNDGIKVQIKSKNEEKDVVAGKLGKETDEQKKKVLKTEQEKIDENITSLEKMLKDVEKQLETKKKELEDSKKGEDEDNKKEQSDKQRKQK